VDFTDRRDDLGLGAAMVQCAARSFIRYEATGNAVAPMCAANPRSPKEITEIRIVEGEREHGGLRYTHFERSSRSI
jgi:hypothetical protein